MLSVMPLWTLTVRVTLAAVLTALLGLEREIRNKDAGLRTYTLVGIGSALVMIVSQYGYDTVIRTGVALDPSRTAAQVVSGIGFLGAGLIFLKQDIVRGLTTAAGIWVSAAIGLAVGSGMVLLGVFTTGLALVVLYAFHLIERGLFRSKRESIEFEITCPDRPGVLSQVATLIARAGGNIEKVDLRRLDDEQNVSLRLAVTDLRNANLIVDSLPDWNVTMKTSVR